MSLDYTIAQGEIVCLNRTIKADLLWAKAQSLLQDENGLQHFHLKTLPVQMPV